MKRALLIVFCVLVAALVSCGRKQIPLTILTEDYPPLSFAAGNTVSGYGADVVAAIQARLKTSYKPSLVDWDEAYRRAISEPNIVLFTMERTPERENLVHWIGPLGENKTYFYAYKSRPIELQDLEQAKSIKAIATTTNWFSEQYLKSKGFDNLVSSVKPSDSIKQLVSGRVEMSAFSEITFRQIAEDTGYVATDFIPVFEIMSSNYYIAISKGTDSKVVEAWTKAFDQIKADGSLEKIRAKWL
ncbi:MAG TPA: ABC transporter substrate-binding protein [Candidatus Cloacimonadota bacterium]|nr:ABC transporter substrate-binding protein [Candidatus Cloacimonadota bacterium]